VRGRDVVEVVRTLHRVDNPQLADIDRFKALRTFGRTEPSAAEHQASVEAAKAVTPVEQGWLQSHIDADGARDPYEEALLAFIAEEQGQKPQS
jgi:hypothetical protein